MRHPLLLSIQRHHMLTNHRRFGCHFDCKDVESSVVHAVSTQLVADVNNRFII